MLFVTVGTHNQGFDRLIKEADKIAPQLAEKIFMQIGCTGYKPKNCAYKDFLPQKDFERACMEASVIITHGGIGSIMTPLIMEKKIVVVPRLKEYNEHTDDHQLQITKELENQKKIIAVYNIANLMDAIKKAKKFKVKSFEKNKKIPILIETFIQKNYENRYSIKQMP